MNEYLPTSTANGLPHNLQARRATPLPSAPDWSWPASAWPAVACPAPARRSPAACWSAAG
ncbi:hypothetical protein ACPA9J_18365 [Pseudomonas aeruginosa]